MIVYLARYIGPFVMYCVNGKPRSSLLIESTDSDRSKSFYAITQLGLCDVIGGLITSVHSLKFS